MNLRLLFCVGMGLFTTYIGLVMLVRGFNQPPLPPPLPKPNFKTVIYEYVDPATGETTVEKQITVTTKLVGNATPERVTAPEVPEVPPVPEGADKGEAAVSSRVADKVPVTP